MNTEQKELLHWLLTLVRGAHARKYTHKRMAWALAYKLRYSNWDALCLNPRMSYAEWALWVRETSKIPRSVRVNTKVIPRNNSRNGWINLNEALAEMSRGFVQ